MKEIKIDENTPEKLQAGVKKANAFLANQYQEDLERLKKEMANYEPKGIEVCLCDKLYTGKMQ